MNYDQLIKAASLYHIPQTKIDSARRLINFFSQRAINPYVAFSGGKDSAVLLHLVGESQAMPVVFIDEGWILPGTLLQIAASELAYQTRFIRVHDRRGAKEFKAEFGHYPIWIQDRSLSWIGETHQEMLKHYSWDGTLTGMRSEESTQRHFTLKHPLRWHKGLSIWRCDPLHNWTWMDIWAYIVQNNLPVHPAYRDLIDAGIPPQNARVGPLTAVRVYQYGSLSIIKRLYPDLWNRFAEANPCVQHYG